MDGLLERCMGSEALLKRLLQKFLADPSYAALAEAFKKGNENEALQAAHTLKGVCGNLSITGLFRVLERQVQVLRAHDMGGAALLMPEVTLKYAEAVQAIQNAFD